MTSQISNQDYYKDFDKWLILNINLLKNKKYELLDTEYLKCLNDLIRIVSQASAIKFDLSVINFGVDNGLSEIHFNTIKYNCIKYETNQISKRLRRYLEDYFKGRKLHKSITLSYTFSSKSW